MKHYIESVEDNFLFRDFMSRKNYTFRIVVLLFCEGLSYSEIATAIGISPQTVNNIVCQIRKEWLNG